MHIKEAFAERLKRLRESYRLSKDKFGLSQNELADKLGVSRGSISFYENGDRTPDIEFLEKAALFFGVSYNYLLGKTDFKYPDIEIDIQAVCKHTGLTEEAVKILIDSKQTNALNLEVLNVMLCSFGDYEYESNQYCCMLSKIADYIYLDTNKIYYFRPSENRMIEYEYDSDMPSGICVNNEDILITADILLHQILTRINGFIDMARQEVIGKREWAEREAEREAQLAAARAAGEPLG